MPYTIETINKNTTLTGQCDANGKYLLGCSFRCLLEELFIFEFTGNKKSNKKLVINKKAALVLTSFYKGQCANIMKNTFRFNGSFEFPISQTLWRALWYLEKCCVVQYTLRNLTNPIVEYGCHEPGEPNRVSMVSVQNKGYLCTKCGHFKLLEQGCAHIIAICLAQIHLKHLKIPQDCQSLDNWILRNLLCGS